MTPEEELIVNKLALDLLICVNAVMREEGEQMEQRIRSLGSRLFKERRKAVEVERERCATLAEQIGQEQHEEADDPDMDRSGDTGRKIADAIRAR